MGPWLLAHMAQLNAEMRALVADRRAWPQWIAHEQAILAWIYAHPSLSARDALDTAYRDVMMGDA